MNVIVDAEASARAGWPLVALAAACVGGGARLIQVRGKTVASGALLDAAREIVAIGRRAGAITIVNDRADVAKMADADGVHLGQTDLSPAAARGIVGPDAIVGRSTHTPAQIDAASQEPIDYLAIGPVFATSTKATGYDAVGLSMVERAAHAGRRIGRPVVAIGGITIETAASVIEAGASSVAVIGDLFATGDPEQRVREYIARLERI